MLYNYAFYLFSAAFNQLFLVYAALFALPVFALIVLLPQLDVEAIGRGFRERTPVKAISVYMLLVGLVLGGLWAAQSLAFVFTGQVPQVVVDSGHPTGVIFAVDLTMLVPFFFLGAAWLWRRRPWGYVLGTAINVSGAIYTLALAGMGFSADRSVVAGAELLIPLWLALSAASLVSAGALLANLRPAPGGQRQAKRSTAKALRS
jgi:hypothetical protein